MTGHQEEGVPFTGSSGSLRRGGLPAGPGLRWLCEEGRTARRGWVGPRVSRTWKQRRREVPGGTEGRISTTGGVPVAGGVHGASGRTGGWVLGPGRVRGSGGGAATVAWLEVTPFWAASIPGAGGARRLLPTPRCGSQWSSPSAARWPGAPALGRRTGAPPTRLATTTVASSWPRSRPRQRSRLAGSRRRAS